ncbi:Pleiotropic drug resistance ABC transporter [Melia azedarach]|uniref:Pleiotropic drug resistance ABC transporter n=1 Tax=Melia azedarach TaxID=155640 RepID=A0ACC1X881_MELAZ|nr:Pleiotropic drug resistance ABC transporter [Melia azedarach]
MGGAGFAVVVVLLFSGIASSRLSFPDWLKWAFWVSPATYADIGLSVNEFLAPWWQKKLFATTNVGRSALESRGVNFEGYFFWISIGALIGLLYYSILASHWLCVFRKLPEPPVQLFHMKSFQRHKMMKISVMEHMWKKSPRVPRQVSIQNLPKAKWSHLLNLRQLLFRGIKINGYPKVQETFARISGYCKQTDIHSPQITVEESLVFSAWLRLSPQIDSKTKMEFVNEVLETIELDGIKDYLVGIPGISGLSIEQRKRLTIAVELVGNPSIIFMDEPTTALDARAALLSSKQ